VSPEAYTVSYRSQVRLPDDGAVLSADGFASQLRKRDPVSPIRCLADESPAFRDLTAFLGGIAWSHPVAIVKDASFPPLYDGKYEPMAEGASASDGAARAPDIERPDLVGVQSGIAIFLSKQHGLVAVDARGATPSLSCSMKLPGEPKNFLFRGNEIVVVVNARDGSNHSALVRYAFDGATFHFVDAVRLDNQTIQDARLFDSTIVAYTSWSKPGTSNGVGTVGGATGGSRGGAMAPSTDYGSNDNHLGSKVIVVQWDDALGVDWEDSLLDDRAKQDPTEGLPPTTYTPGQLVSETKTYKSFVAASDRYVAVPRAVTRTRFSRYETYSYQVCTKYNPQYEQVEQCHVSYERRDNPDYRPPNPTTGDYSCNGKSLADCIQEAAPTVSKDIYVPVGQSCDMVWVGRCETYETRTETYPRFDTEQATELTVYRFENATFTKLDASLATMTQKNDAIAFEKDPLAVKGAIANKNQIQFQNGHLYVFADQALQTLAVAGNSISYLHRLAVAASTDSSPSIVFSDDRAMISAQGYTDSQVAMLDLSVPSAPKTVNSFSMPGRSTQLILAPGGILGPGQVSFTDRQVPRTLEKLTLFSRAGGQELDNLLLGTEYDAFDSSWFDPSDDQRIRLGGQRLFLPYSGQRHAMPFEPFAHRLNISRVEGDRLISERSFETSDDVIRTAGIDDARSLAFANSATYLVDHGSGDWVMTTLRELFVPFATYRLDDEDLHATISRVGSKCRVTTHIGDAKVFDADALATLDIPCPELGVPVGFHSNLLFAQTHTGVRISADGLVIEALSAADVADMLSKVPTGYCWVPGASNGSNGSPIDFLDAVPSQILCEAAK
jgi:hypothetical protein